MSVCSIEFKINGIGSMLMHNGRLADQLDFYTKALKPLTSAKKKSDEKHLEIGMVEWEGGLYMSKANPDGSWAEDSIPTIPANVLYATLLNGAKKSKKGTSYKSGVFVNDDAKFTFASASKTLAELRKNPAHHDRRMENVQGKKIARTRPIFSDWSATFTVDYDPSIIDAADVVQLVTDAGRLVGIGDRRPAYGRFEIVSAKEV